MHCTVFVPGWWLKTVKKLSVGWWTLLAINGCYLATGRGRLDSFQTSENGRKDDTSSAPKPSSQQIVWWVALAVRWCVCHFWWTVESSTQCTTMCTTCQYTNWSTYLRCRILLVCRDYFVAMSRLATRTNCHSFRLVCHPQQFCAAMWEKSWFYIDIFSIH